MGKDQLSKPKCQILCRKVRPELSESKLLHADAIF